MRLTTTELDAMVEEATVDAYDEYEQFAAFHAAIENHLALPFDTTVLGVTVVSPPSRNGPAAASSPCADAAGTGRRRRPRPAAARTRTHGMGLGGGVPALGVLSRNTRPTASPHHPDLERQGRHRDRPITRSNPRNGGTLCQRSRTASQANLPANSAPASTSSRQTGLLSTSTKRMRAEVGMR